MKKSLGASVVRLLAPVWVVGSYDAAGKPNAMTASWAGICCSRPPCVAVSLRRATYSYSALVARRAFTVNIPPASFATEADYLGIASGRDGNKLARAGFTAVSSDLVDAPYLAEFPLVMECKVLHIVEIGLHVQFIGEIMDVKAEESVLDAAGAPDPDKARPFALAMDGYRALGEHLGPAFTIGREMARTGQK